jgi:hypothetical protein
MKLKNIEWSSLEHVHEILTQDTQNFLSTKQSDNNSTIRFASKYAAYT